MQKPIQTIELQDVSKYYNKKRVGLRDCTIQMESGTINAFIGKNGSGKTTTLKLILGLIYPTYGKVCIDETYSSLLQYQQVGYLPEKVHLPTNVVLSDLLMYIGLSRGLSAKTCKAEIKTLADYYELDLSKKLKASESSKGMAQKAAIIQAFLHRPNCCILDEPTSGLDPIAKKQLFDHIKKVSQHSMVIISGHHLDELQGLIDNFYVFDKNRCLGKQKLSQETDNYIIYTNSALSEQAEERLFRTFPMLQKADTNGYQIDVEMQEINLVLAFFVKQGIAIAKIEKSVDSLESLYLKMVNGETK